MGHNFPPGGRAAALAKEKDVGAETRPLGNRAKALELTAEDKTGLVKWKTEEREET